ncbi:hypothetical protein VTN00DRAFT_687 [Thermoascus crustaceus]|uniref:uncharacterized protein n=1 Tax=Thermoascus crustaceus TaxID=5088 RepID=UPI0037421491
MRPTLPSFVWDTIIRRVEKILARRKRPVLRTVSSAGTKPENMSGDESYSRIKDEVSTVDVWQDWNNIGIVPQIYAPGYRQQPH